MASFSIENSNREFLPFKRGIHLSKGQSHKNSEEKELMSEKIYASTVGSLVQAMLCIGKDIFYSVGIVSRYKSDPEEDY